MFVEDINSSLFWPIINWFFISLVLIFFIATEKLLCYLKKNDVEGYKKLTLDLPLPLKTLCLTPISGFLGLFVVNPKDDEKTRHYKKIIRASFFTAMLLLMVGGVLWGR